MSEQLDPYPGNLRKHEVAPSGSDGSPAQVSTDSQHLICQAWKPLLSDDDLSEIASQGHYAPYVSPLHVVRSSYERERARLTRENEALRRERLTNEVFARVVAWLRNPQRKPAGTAFTAGMERQIGYALELDVLPHVKRMEIKAVRHHEALKALLHAGERMHDFIGELPPSIKDNASGIREDWRTATQHTQP